MQGAAPCGDHAVIGVGSSQPFKEPCSFILCEQTAQPLMVEAYAEVVFEIALEEVAVAVHIGTQLILVKVGKGVGDIVQRYGRFCGQYRLELHLVEGRQIRELLGDTVELIEELHIAELFSSDLRHGGLEVQVHAFFDTANTQLTGNTVGCLPCHREGDPYRLVLDLGHVLGGRRCDL